MLIPCLKYVSGEQYALTNFGEYTNDEDYDLDDSK